MEDCDDRLVALFKTPKEFCSQCYYQGLLFNIRHHIHVCNSKSLRVVCILLKLAQRYSTHLFKFGCNWCFCSFRCVT